VTEIGLLTDVERFNESAIYAVLLAGDVVNDGAGGVETVTVADALVVEPPALEAITEYTPASLA
jgi:hypothetical protein